MRDALLLVDLIQTFEHEEGDALLESFRRRHGAILGAIESARAAELAVIYANDNYGTWDGDATRLVKQAVEGRGGSLIEAIVPREGDRFVVKPRYSAFDHTPLALILRELEIERSSSPVRRTEMCVVQTAIDAREEGYKVTILADACATTDEAIGAARVRVCGEDRRRVRRAGRPLAAAAASAAAAAAPRSRLAAEGRLCARPVGGEDRELLPDVRVAAVRAVRLLAVANELLEVRLALHADVLVDRHGSDSISGTGSRTQVAAEKDRGAGSAADPAPACAVTSWRRSIVPGAVTCLSLQG